MFVVKCRGGLPASSDSSNEMQEEGSMTGLTVSDKETGKCVSISLSTLECAIGKPEMFFKGSTFMVLS